MKDVYFQTVCGSLSRKSCYTHVIVLDAAWMPFLIRSAQWPRTLNNVVAADRTDGSHKGNKYWYELEKMSSDDRRL